MWDELWKIVLGVVTSVGGIGVVIVAAVKFSTEIIAKRLEEKYTLKMNKELEKYRVGLDNKIYISKTKFDTEFAIYRELSKSFFLMMKDITRMIPAGYAEYPADKDDREKYENELYDKALKSTVSAQDYLYCNIPFIPEEFEKAYLEVLSLCQQQLAVFELRWNVGYMATDEEKKRFSREDFQRSRDIREKHDALTRAVRAYLAKLDVLD